MQLTRATYIRLCKINRWNECHGQSTRMQNATGSRLKTRLMEQTDDIDKTYAVMRAVYDDFTNLEMLLNQGTTDNIDSHLLSLRTWLQERRYCEIALPDSFIDVIFKLFAETEDTAVRRLSIQIIDIISRRGPAFLTPLLKSGVVSLTTMGLERWPADASISDSIVSIMNNFVECGSDEQIPEFVSVCAPAVVLSVCREAPSPKKVVQCLKCVVAMLNVDAFDEQGADVTIDTLVHVVDRHMSDPQVCALVCQVVRVLDAVDKTMGLMDHVIAWFASDDCVLVREAALVIGHLASRDVFLGGINIEQCVTILERFPDSRLYEAVTWALGLYVAANEMTLNRLFGEQFAEKIAGLCVGEISYACKAELVMFLCIACSLVKVDHLKYIMHGSVFPVIIKNLEMCRSEKMSAALFACLENIGTIGERCIVDTRDSIAEAVNGCFEITMLTPTDEEDGFAEHLAQIFRQYPFLFAVSLA